MNLNHLRYFVKLAQVEHYTKAADELFITQPSLSHAINQLEGELGVPLFERDGRNVLTTKYGKEFLKDVKASLDILDYGVNTIRLIGWGEGHIDIGLLRTLGTDFVPKLVKGFMEEYKNKKIDFRFHTGVTYDLIQGIKEKRYDAVFCSKYGEDAEIDYHPVGKQDLVLIVPNGHPLADRDSIDLAETLPYPQIIFTQRSGLRHVVDGLFRKVGKLPDICYEVEEDQVIAGMVANNFGIAVVPRMFILDILPVKQIEIATPSWERLFYFAVHKRIYHAPVVNDFNNYIIKNSNAENQC